MRVRVYVCAHVREKEGDRKREKERDKMKRKILYAY